MPLEAFYSHGLDGVSSVGGSSAPPSTVLTFASGTTCAEQEKMDLENAVLIQEVTALKVRSSEAGLCALVV